MVGPVESFTVRETFIEVVLLPGARVSEGLFIKLAPDNTTAPFLASNLPSIVAVVFIVMEVNASMFPLNEVPLPMVAELPTCQVTFLAWAPPLRITFPPAPPMVVKSDAIWKIHTAFASPCASRVRSPDCIKRVDVDL